MKTKIKYPWFRTFVRQYLIKVIIALVIIELLVITFLQNKNVKPVAGDDQSKVYQEYTVDIPVLQNDSDEDIEDELTITSMTNPEHGTAEIRSRVIHYVPEAGFSGYDRLSYTISDGKDEAVAWIEIHVEPNLAPTPGPDTVELYPWTKSVEIAVLGNDVDREGDPVTLDTFTNPKSGTVERVGETFVYHLTDSSITTDEFTYTVSDGNRVSDPCVVSINIKAVENPQFCASTPWGDIRQHESTTIAHWEIKEEGDNLVYGLNTTDYNSPGGNRLGEYSIVKDQPLEGDFTMKLRYQMVDDLAKNGGADCAVVFAFVDPLNYCYLSLSAGSEGSGATGLFKVIDGQRENVSFKGRAVQDNNWHSIELVKVGNTITASQDGEELASGSDDAFAKVGSVGIGSYNDQALFDDIEVVQR